ncbi:AMP-binding protein [Pedobacter lithocola]|uniref:AMP-binding protein n=1 Tax=Pedobacter lithocola TaxID=1908239 RepID=A0ABV8P858_9SPHI
MDLVKILKLHFENNTTAVSEKSKDYSYYDFCRYCLYARAYYVEHNIKKVLITAPQGFYAYTLIWGAYLAGTTFCPVNVGLPKDRKDYFIKEFEPDLMIDTEIQNNAISNRLTTPDSFYKNIDQALTGFEFEIPQIDSTAYIIFTSGSTGLPKGVMISRKSLNNFISFSVEEFSSSPNDVWGQYSNLGFDISILDIFTAIISGAILVPFPGTAEKLLPAKIIKEKKITIWHSVPSAIDLMLKTNHINKDIFGHVKTMIFGGERLFPSQVQLLFDANPELIIYNCYGPTETTIYATYQKLAVHNYLDYCTHTVSMGKPLPNYGLVLQNKEENLAELVITGDFIGSGYLGLKSDSSNTAFKEITVDDVKHWSYATGDYVEFVNHNLYYVCRKDSQIKIRGNRIDLSEIDYALREFGCITNITTCIEDKVIAFIVLEDYSEAKLQDYLKKKLPPYYIPNKIINKKSFPFNTSGKIDIKKLLSELA